MRKGERKAKEEFDEVLGPNSGLVGEKLNMPLLVQVENDLKIPVRIVLKFVTIEDETTLFVEVAECPSKK